MKEKRESFVFLALLLIFIFPLVASANETAINNGYQCLKEQIDEKTCELLSTTEKIFSVLAVNECKVELIDSIDEDDCWPSGNCDVKTTSQAILALGKSTTSDSQEWLLTQNATPTEINWFLQIDTDDVSTCDISYDSNTYQISVDEQKVLSGDVGNCLSISPSGYLLEISDSCYSNEFSISCNQDFVTNLLFKHETSSTLHVSSDTHSATSDGITKEKVNAYCFLGSSGTCDYEASLWGALTIDYLGKDVTPYLPYLIILADENIRFLPSSFLYSLTEYPEFFSDLKSLQLSSGYWQPSGDKYYDTALAIFSFPSGISPERTKAEDALLNDQQQSGCWDSNSILKTAFILHSFWPTKSTPGEVIPGGGGQRIDCVTAGYTCTSSYNCNEAGGNLLSASDYSCTSFISICCDTPVNKGLCEIDLNGEICTSSQRCTDPTVSADDTTQCCLDTCVERTTSTSCESVGGVCEPSLCGSGYSENSAYTCDFGGICCFQESPPSPVKSKLWLWILIILILLIVIAIIFRDSLRTAWLRMKSGSGRKPSSSRFGHSPSFPSFPSSAPPRRIMPRSVMPTQHRPMHPPPRRPPKSKISGELDHVLDKLKKMGNK